MVRFSWYVLDTSDVQVIRVVRDEVIRQTIGGQANPARMLVQVAAMVRAEFLVEVDAVVALPGSQAPGLS